MIRQLKNGLTTVQDVHASCSHRIKQTQSLNAYIKVTEEISRLQAIDSENRFAKGKEMIKLYSFFIK